MKPGTKPGLPSIREERGTLRPDRGDSNLIELVAPDDLPKMPEWLTAAGEEVWQDEVGRIAQGRLISESDTTFFGNYCNLQGMIILAWRDNQCPPPQHLIEVRKLQEFLGIAGAKSRVVKIDKSSDGPNGNPYNRFKRRM